MKITTRNVQFRDPNGRMVSSAIIANGSLHDEVIDYLDNNPQALGDAVVDATESWLAENITEPTQPAVDASLSVAGAAADAKKVGDELSDLKSEIAQGSGLTNDIKTALLNIFKYVPFLSSEGEIAYDALETALNPPTNLSYISAVYTQGSTIVYETDSLDSLKSNLVVTAHYDDLTTETVTSYTLSGMLTEGTSTITVTYSGKTTTFNVTVTADPFPSDTYQRVEWVGSETTSTSASGPYILTDITESGMSQLNGYVIELSVAADMSAYSSGTGTFLGFSSKAGTYINTLGQVARFGIGAAETYALPASIVSTNRNDLTVEYSSTGITLRCGSDSVSRTYSTSGDATQNLYIGAGFVSSNAPKWLKYYGNISVKKNNTLVGDFYPCYRKSDNAIGFYDMVSEKFYAKANTSNFEFIKGGDI